MKKTPIVALLTTLGIHQVTSTPQPNTITHLHQHNQQQTPHRSLSQLNNLITSLNKVKSSIDSKLFLYQTPAYQWIPSTVYRYDDFLQSLKVMATEGVAGKLFYTGEDSVEEGHVYGLVNVAAFLAQSMKETIQYDACDENSWDLINGKYPLSNACGQLGQSYQDYHCSDEEKHMECPVDPNMSITGITHAKWYGAPGPFFCGPKSEYSFTGIWDHLYECNKSWANPPETCDIYEGQKAGRYDNSYSYANAAGRTDVEGCCWWGRGVIQTSGVCNFGKLNYYLGAGAAADNRPSKYPSIDFCKDPEIICSSPEYGELKWIAGMFYWMESVQSYNVGGWDYLTELRAFVEGGMNGATFINAVSGIVNRGCHNPPCGTGALDGGPERSDNFKKVLNTFFPGGAPDVEAPQSDPGSGSGSGNGVSAPTPKPTRPPVDPNSDAGVIINSVTFKEMETVLESSKANIDNQLFLYQTPAYQWIPSSVYRYDDFFESLFVMASEGVAGKKFYIGEDVENGHVYGLVNIAAFLGQSMKETIQYDACDENSWDLINGKYPLSNACGQLGQSYQDYHCSDEEKHMECPVDPNMSITGVTHAKWYGAPGPFFCGPKSEYSFTGIWDHLYECNKSWANPPETCDVYEGQKAGKYDNSYSYANAAGRTDVEGCCWWGRGVIQTSGVCNFGKLNYYLGAGAAADNRSSRYPSIDFCKDPEVICSSAEFKELKWIAGMFYWMESVQSYNVDGWDYLTELRAFVEGGMNGATFINAVSGIVNRGCHNPPCGTGALDGGPERRDNFNKVLNTFFPGGAPNVGSTGPNDPPPGEDGGVSSSGCPPSWSRGETYSEGDLVVADGEVFSCKAFPNNGWCGLPNYEPNVGAHWGMAWTLSGECKSPTASPTPPPTRQPVDPNSDVGIILNSDTFVEMKQVLESSKDNIDNQLFLYQTPAYQWIPSSVYRFDDFYESLFVMATEGVAGKKFYIGEDVENGHVYGLVNIAAFLGQSMKETIQYDACDENSWDLINGKYPLSNACGQLGQSYQDYHCSEEEKHMECPVDPNMSITGVTHAKWYGAPGPFFCGPKSEYSFTGVWDHLYECNKGWANPPEFCEEYEGQKAGKYDNSFSYANAAGRTDVEGCCWWGRGVIQTSGVCNFGKLNYYLGAGAAADNRPSRYPSVDFCKDPEVICSSAEYKELKWIAGMFYWMESVQSYNVGGWNYLKELRAFVEGGMNGATFINAVSGIVNRGCHNPPCGTGAVDGGWERSNNFKKVLDTFFPEGVPDVGPVTFAESTSSSPGASSADAFASDGPSSTSAADGFVSGGLYSGAVDSALFPSLRQQSVLLYSCGKDNEAIPSDSLLVDILFEYEISVRVVEQASHVLPELKQEIMGELASVLGCEEAFQRGLRESEKDQVLLGFQSAEGSDIIDGEKGSCDGIARNESSTHCVPVIGHLAAIVTPGVSKEAIESTKKNILRVVSSSMKSGRLSSDYVQDVAFVREHAYDYVGSVQPESSSSDDVDSPSGTPAWIPTLASLLVLLIVAVSVMFVVRRRTNRKNDARARVKGVDSTRRLSCSDHDDTSDEHGDNLETGGQGDLLSSSTSDQESFGNVGIGNDNGFGTDHLQGKPYDESETFGGPEVAEEGLPVNNGSTDFGSQSTGSVPCDEGGAPTNSDEPLLNTPPAETLSSLLFQGESEELQIETPSKELEISVDPQGLEESISPIEPIAQDSPEVASEDVFSENEKTHHAENNSSKPAKYSLEDFISTHKKNNYFAGNDGEGGSFA